jgi:hypothetical protein
MTRMAKHLSLHRIDGTELRVVSDVAMGILSVIQAEEDVIRQYQAVAPWPHHWVTLFILQDMQPLTRQLRSRDGATPALSSLPPGGAEALEARPVVNAYDLAAPSNCHVFVNQRAMQLAGYWEDALAVRALLAHEHAHPMAENDTVRASRQFRLETSTPTAMEGELTGPTAQIARQATLLAEELLLYGPREVAANELALRCGFAGALFHLDRCGVAAARQALAGREELKRRLQHEQHSGRLTASEAGALLLLADLQSYAHWTFEVAAFDRANEDRFARELETVLWLDVFPQLAPEVSPLYMALAAQYRDLRPDYTGDEYSTWGQNLLQMLSQAIAAHGIDLHLSLCHAQEE